MTFRCIAALTAALMSPGSSVLAEPVTEREPAATARGALEPAMSLWVQPLGAIASGLEGALYLPLGANFALEPHSDLVLEATPTAANWYGCDTRSAGGWGTVGLALFARPGRTGWFVHPKLIGRSFRTSGGASSGGWFSCDHRALQGWDIELRGGADLGYAWRWGRASVAAAVGASAGYCWNCVGERPITFMGLVPTHTRGNRAALAINPNLLRVGMTF